MTESRQLSWPAYLVSITLIVLPMSDTWTTLYPWRFLDPRWRFGAVGLVSNALLVPILGLLIAYLTATLLDQRTTRRVIGGVSLFCAVLCVGALGTFVLDALQTRATVRPEMKLSFTVASFAAAFKALLALACFTVIGIASLRRRRTDAKQGNVPLFSVEKVPQAAKK